MRIERAVLLGLERPSIALLVNIDGDNRAPSEDLGDGEEKAKRRLLCDSLR